MWELKINGKSGWSLQLDRKPKEPLLKAQKHVSARVVVLPIFGLQAAAELLPASWRLRPWAFAYLFLVPKLLVCKCIRLKCWICMHASDSRGPFQRSVC